MRKCALAVVIVFASLVCGQVTVSVYESDETTPFNWRDIMAGTKLALIVSSDSNDCNDYWSGGLFIGGDDRGLGTLSAWDYDANTRDYTGSHFEEAGNLARVAGWKDSSIWGFDMYTFYPVYGDYNDANTQPGNWFIIDYTAEKVGDCNIGFYDYSVSWDEPIFYITFTQGGNCDFNRDGKVDFQDYAILASNWNRIDCAEPNWCRGTDLNLDGNVDLTDLAGFMNFWLWPELSESLELSESPELSELPELPNDNNEPQIPGDDNEPQVPNDDNEPQVPGDDNEPQVPVDSNVIIRIVDINDNNEITIGVNESITLYLRLTTTEQGGLGILCVDAMISDTNLGSIDNREYNPDDPNNPNNGTARILAEPRDPLFDYVGPGYEQPDGIILAAVNFEADFNDGNLASFVFTCRGEGDVTLSLKDYSTDTYLRLEGIVIHQVNPNSQQMMMDGSGAAAEGSQVSEDVDVDELASWLEELANDPNLSETTNESDWSEFIETVENSGE